MWGWIILVGAVLVVLLLAFKFKEIRHKFFLIIIALVLLFLVFSFAQVYSLHKADLTTFDGIVSVGKLYFLWLGNMFSNLGKATSFVIHQDWGLNITNSTG